MIINEISHENNSVRVQAYQLTSTDIANALVDAKRRGVIVKIIILGDTEVIANIILAVIAILRMLSIKIQKIY